MERRKFVLLALLTLCLTITFSIQPITANSISAATGYYQLRLYGSGVIMDMQTGRIVGWNARLTGTAGGYFEADEEYGEVWKLGFDVDYVNLYFSWTRSPFGFGKMAYSWGPEYIPVFGYDLNPPYPLADSMTWKVNFNIDLGPLQAPISFTVRWYGPYASGRMGTISGTYKGPIPIPDTPLVFIPTGTFSYGIRFSGSATIDNIYYP